MSGDIIVGDVTKHGRSQALVLTEEGGRVSLRLRSTGPSYYTARDEGGSEGSLGGPCFWISRLIMGLKRMDYFSLDILPASVRIGLRSDS